MCFWIAGCNSEPQHDQPNFYFWKTTFVLSDYEKITLNHLKVNHLYVRMFDVAWDNEKQEANPVGILNAGEDMLNYEVTPVVYIKNVVFKKLDLAQSKTLAALVYRQVSMMSDKYRFRSDELQLDCDWTESTMEKYFAFLSELKRISQLHISVTIRLHQIKYKEKTGIPPADYGVLMFYNMGKIDAEPNRNSIYNKEDALKYVEYIQAYPKPLAVALPIFSWGIHCRNGQVKRILPRREYVDFSEHSSFAIDSPYVRVIEPVVYKGIAFEKNDYIKLEYIDQQKCEEAAQMLKEHAPKKGFVKVLFFDLDEHSLNHFNHEEITDIYQLLP